MRIVTEDLRGCLGSCADTRYYVIEEPINETGICFQFDTLAEAEAFIAANKKRANEYNQSDHYSAACSRGCFSIKE